MHEYKRLGDSLNIIRCLLYQNVSGPLEYVLCDKILIFLEMCILMTADKIFNGVISYLNFCHMF